LIALLGGLAAELRLPLSAVARSAIISSPFTLLAKIWFSNYHKKNPDQKSSASSDGRQKS
jgi:hypothetical protein